MKPDTTMSDSWWVQPLREFLGSCPETALLVRLRGLPYECSAAQIIEFFRNGAHPAEVLNGEAGVFFVKKRDGKSTGDALVLFENDTAVLAAMTKNKHIIGVRYIELFRTSLADAEQIVRRNLDAKSRPFVPRNNNHRPMLPMAMQMPGFNIPTLPFGGTAKDCLRFRGLPLDVQVKNLLDFMGGHAANIVYQGVHMILNAMGQPSGEAIVQMNSEAEACIAAVQCNNGFMFIGQKQCYIEVVQCSGQEVKSYLTGAGQPSLPPPGECHMMMVPQHSGHPGMEPLYPSPPQYSPSTPPPLVFVPASPDGFYPVPTTPDWPDFLNSQMMVYVHPVADVDVPEDYLMHQPGMPMEQDGGNLTAY